jgi:hypothetical protein
METSCIIDQQTKVHGEPTHEKTKQKSIPNILSPSYSAFGEMNAKIVNAKMI